MAKQAFSMRYFAELAYKGTAYFGWQRQPEQISVQEQIENALSTILNLQIPIVGCGRTDTGVHASQYFIHFDFEGDFPQEFVRRLNKFLPPDIVIYRIFPVAADAHARYDATRRAYEYHLSYQKDPFSIDTNYFFPFAHQLDLFKLQEGANLLLQYEDFFPFCKSRTDVKTMKCELFRSEWEIQEGKKLIFHIAANRFLRGMVRLIVGMCLKVGLGKVKLEEVQQAMEQQTRLERSWSVPPEGLFLTEVVYPEVLHSFSRK